MLTIKERNLLYKLGNIENKNSEYVSDAVSDQIRSTFSSIFKKDKTIRTFRIKYNEGFKGKPLTAEIIKYILEEAGGDTEYNYEVEELTEL